jgi:hypothetical protein
MPRIAQYLVLPNTPYCHTPGMAKGWDTRRSGPWPAPRLSVHLGSAYASSSTELTSSWLIHDRHLPWRIHYSQVVPKDRRFSK